MIKLEVAGYCQNCPEFEPEVEKDVQDYSRFDQKTLSFVGPRYCNTTITCEHAARCQTIRGYIQREVEKKK